MSRYLSNGTMGEMWLSCWCYECENDHCASHVAEDDAEWEKGCQILARLYLASADEVIPELVDRTGEPWEAWEAGGKQGSPPGWDPALLECKMFTPCQQCHPGGENDGPSKPFDPGPDQMVFFTVVDQTPATPMVVVPNPDFERSSVIA